MSDLTYLPRTHSTISTSNISSIVSYDHWLSIMLFPTIIKNLKFKKHSFLIFSFATKANHKPRNHSQQRLLLLVHPRPLNSNITTMVRHTSCFHQDICLYNHGFINMLVFRQPVRKQSRRGRPNTRHLQKRRQRLLCVFRNLPSQN